MDRGARCRVLVLTAGMGGGHTQVSNELQRRLAERGHDVTVSDLLELMPRPAGRFLRWLYPWMVNHTPWLYDFVYDHFFRAPQRGGSRAAVPVLLATPRLRELVARMRPDLVVSTYHLAGVCAARLRAAGELAAPAVTFITTFGVHNLWLHEATDLYLCITEEAARQVRARGHGPVAVCEPVVRPQFHRPVPPPARPVLGLPPGRLALVVAGSLGLGPVAEAARVIGASEGWSAVVVCGRNETLRRRLDGTPGVVALGWVDDMAGLVQRADLLVDNAAGSSAKEALALGVPVLTYRPIAGHGRDDALMMQRAGVGVVLDRPDQLRRLLAAPWPDAAAVERVAAGQALFGADPTQWLEAAAHGRAPAVAAA